MKITSPAEPPAITDSRSLDFAAEVTNTRGTKPPHTGAFLRAINADTKNLLKRFAAQDLDSTTIEFRGEIPLPLGRTRISLVAERENTDKDGNTRSRTAPVKDAQITVCINDPPVAMGDSSNPTDEDTVLEIPASQGVLTNDTDSARDDEVDDGQLNVGKVQEDSSAVGREIMLPPVAPSTVGGMLQLNSDGSFQYDPRGAFDFLAAGEQHDSTFTYEASDGIAGDTATVTVAVRGVNDAPVAIADEYSTREDETLSVGAAAGVLANDEDPDRGSSVTATLVRDVPAGDGKLTFNSDGSFTFDPQTDFNGETSFTYVASDGMEDSQQATVTLRVDSVIDAPTITGFTVDSGVPGDRITNATRVRFSGMSEPSEPGDPVLIEVFRADTNRLVTTAKSDDQGGWTSELSAAGEALVPDDTYSFYAIATDSSGESPRSDAFTLTVDTTSPEVASDTLAAELRDQEVTEDVEFRFREPDGTTDPVSGFGLEDISLTKSGSSINRIQSGAGVTLRADDPSPFASTYTLEGLRSITTDTGTYTLTIPANNESIVDVAGNPLGQGFSTTFAVDKTKPVLKETQLATPTLPSRLPVPVVRASAAPTTTVSYDVTVSDQQFAGFANFVTISLVDASTGEQFDSTGKLPIPSAAQDDLRFEVETTALTASLTPGQHSLKLLIEDASGNEVETNAFQVFVGNVGEPTIGAPGTPVFTTMYDVRTALNRAIGVADDQLVQPWQMSFDKTTQTVWLTTEAAPTVGQFDPATGRLRVFDLGVLSGVERAETQLQATASAGSSSLLVEADADIPLNSLVTVGLNENAETFVAKGSVIDGGSRRVTINGKLKKDHDDTTVVRIRPLGDNPHGTFFDFNTHLTPRVWVAHRNAGGAQAGPRADLGDGRLSYLDVVDEELVTYDFADETIKQTLRENGIVNGEGDPGLLGFHAVFVDATGDVWFTAPDSNAIVQLDFDDLDGCGLDCRSATGVVHTLPSSLVKGVDTEGEPFEAHALQVVVDQRTGAPWVWMVDVNRSGRVALLRPAEQTELVSRAQSSGDRLVVRNSIDVGSEITIGGGGSSETAVVEQVTGKGPFTLELDRNLAFDHAAGDLVQVDDRWVTWDVDEGTNPSGDEPFSNASGTFVQIDDNETPGIPEDDSVVVTFPVLGERGRGRGGEIGTRGIVHRFSLLDRAKPLSSGAHIETWQIPKIPGARDDIEFAATNQPFVDRSGEIFFIDRYGSVGRLQPDDFDENVAGFYTTRSAKAVEVDPQSPVPLGRIDPTSAPTPVDAAILSELTLQPEDQTTQNAAGLARLDLYEVADKPENAKNERRGTGAFRGALNAANVLYTSLSQNDELGVTVFAESARRQMAAVTSPFKAPKGAITQARMAFQVLRNGSVVLTARGDGRIADDQINLLADMAEQGRLSSDPGRFLIAGEATAVTTDDGRVHLMGRSRINGVVQYTFTPSGNDWEHQDLFDMANWSVRWRPMPGVVLAEDTVPAGPLGFSVTTAQGHWLTIPVDGGDVIDRTAATGSPEAARVYSAVGVTGLGGVTYGYGTNQTGNLIEYRIEAGSTTFRKIQAESRETQMLRNVQARTTEDGIRHVFATDGVSRLVHYEIDAAGNVRLQENISQQTADNGQNFGYFPFQQPFTGRVYTYVAPLVEDDGTIRVYGTNGGDLIEFTRPSGGQWRVANLTNNTNATFGAEGPDTRVPANAVFGGPTAYKDANGGRHILQINAEGEVVEYFTYGDGLFPTDPVAADRFNTQNVNLLTDKRVETDLGADLFHDSPANSTSSAEDPEPSDDPQDGSGSSLPPLPSTRREDVSGDGSVSAVDALLVVNHLNRRGGTALAEGEPVGSDTTYLYEDRFDVNDDGETSALDALLVINYLSRQDRLDQAEGEWPEIGPWLADDDEEEVEMLWDEAILELTGGLHDLN